MGFDRSGNHPSGFQNHSSITATQRRTQKNCRTFTSANTRTRGAAHPDGPGVLRVRSVDRGDGSLFCGRGWFGNRPLCHAYTQTHMRSHAHHIHTIHTHTSRSDRIAETRGKEGRDGSTDRPTNHHRGSGDDSRWVAGDPLPGPGSFGFEVCTHRCCCFRPRTFHDGASGPHPRSSLADGLRDRK